MCQWGDLCVWYGPVGDIWVMYGQVVMYWPVG